MGVLNRVRWFVVKVVAVAALMSGAFVAANTSEADAGERHCIRVYVYYGGGYAYSYCGAYFCYAGQCMNMDNTGGGWGGPLG